jgi:hypothetical protein
MMPSSKAFGLPFVKLNLAPRNPPIYTPFRDRKLRKFYGEHCPLLEPLPNFGWDTPRSFRRLDSRAFDRSIGARIRVTLSRFFSQKVGNPITMEVL